MTITHIFFDVGGVLGSNGWDRVQRAHAAEHFGLDPADFTRRHYEVAGMLEEGRMTLDEYLDATIFATSRPFTRDEFRAFMLGRSEPFPAAIAIARSLSRTDRYRLMTINNESVELNIHRLQRFGLLDIFTAFFSSCWLGVTKPSPRIYELALDDGASIADLLAGGESERAVDYWLQAGQLQIERSANAEAMAQLQTALALLAQRPDSEARRRKELMSQAEPEHSLFIDDRAPNLPPARALGMQTIHYTGPGQLIAELKALGIALEDGGHLAQ